MRGPRLMAAAILAAAATATCGAPAGKTTPTPAPQATSAAQPSGPGRVQLPSGTVYRVELAKTPEEQAQGLMFRESLPEAIALGVRTRVPDFESLPEEGINLEAYLETVGKRLMREALDRCGGVQTKAAELLHMSFRSFRYYAKKYNLVHKEEMYEGEESEGAAEAKGSA